MMFENWIVLPAGIGISTIVSAMGIGGGILWMPFFLIVLHLGHEVAVLTSLLIQITGKGSGSIAYFKQNAVDYKLGCLMLIFAVPGIAAGAYIANTIKTAHAELVLGIFTMLTALLFVSSNQRYADLGESRAKIKKIYPYAWIVALLSVGSGMFSTGIGEWMIPVMRSKMSLRMSNAIATCIFITFGICLIGALIHLIIGGKADWSIVFWGVPGVMIGGQIGPRITKRINEQLLKEMFIFLLTLIGIHLIYNSF
jgi:uncharacterized membrane protein YfcA